MTGPELGERAYLAYRESVGGLNHLGDPMPLWADLPHRIQLAWQAAATDIWQAAFQDIEDAGLRLTNHGEDGNDMDGTDYFNRLPDCPVSGKVSFFSEGHARRWIRWKARKRRGRKCPRRRGWNPPHRVYQCRHCGRWHLTGSRNFIPKEAQP